MVKIDVKLKLINSISIGMGFGSVYRFTPLTLSSEPNPIIYNKKEK